MGAPVAVMPPVMFCLVRGVVVVAAAGVDNPPVVEEVVRGALTGVGPFPVAVTIGEDGTLTPPLAAAAAARMAVLLGG